jgi:hypothetical protein
MSTAQHLAGVWQQFAAAEAAGRSSLYEQIARGVASDRVILTRLSQLPEREQQPNLLLAVVRYLGGTGREYAEFRTYVLTHWRRIRAEMAVRRTQTNEVGRSAVLYPAVAALQGPLALLEVGASAGLLLLLDRYGYEYDGIRVGDLRSPLQIRTILRGPAPIPAAAPEVTWRAGIDLNPLDAGRDDDVAWLRACIWPDQLERLERLDAAVAVARLYRPRLVRGDLLEGTEALATEAPARARLVIYNAATLAYLSARQRTAFRNLVRRLGCTWISLEGPDTRLLPEIRRLSPQSGDFVLAVNEKPVALSGPHGEWLHWQAA